MLLALIFLKFGGPAKKTRITGIKLAGDLLAQVSICKADSQLVRRVDKPSTHDPNYGISRGRSASGFETVDSDRSVKDNRIFIGKNICEDAVLSIGLDLSRHVELSDFISHADVAFAPGVGSPLSIDHEGRVLRALHLENWLELVST
jgi:hypothetical protein